MTDGEFTADKFRQQKVSAGFLDRLARRLVRSRLRALESGRLRFVENGACMEFGEALPADDLAATVNVKDVRFYASVAFAGTVGAAEAYMQGFWTTDDLTAVVRILARNRTLLENMERGSARLTAPLRKFLHWLHRNSRSGSRRNIAAHYDLGNDFFRLWLDETMMYSSAVFERDEMTLHEASIAKLDRICRKLELKPSDHVLEIGTGWGGFAEHAARNYGCRITTTTISKEQYAFAKERIERAGLSDRVTLLLDDYRDLKGSYDKIVSIEMVEAVGHEYLDDFFARCSNLLRPDGMMLLQAITIADQRYQAALKSVDFIQRYIFPGGFLPSVTRLLDASTRATDMRVYHLEDIGEHYAKTLALWKSSFWQQIDQIHGMGFSDEFIRMWNYYYCYCEGAFLERVIGNAQVLFMKPQCRRAPIVPSLDR